MTKGFSFVSRYKFASRSNLEGSNGAFVARPGAWPSVSIDNVVREGFAVVASFIQDEEPCSPFLPSQGGGVWAEDPFLFSEGTTVANYSSNG